MTKRAQLLSLVTFTALCFVSGAARSGGGDVILAPANGDYRADSGRALTCAEATQAAWFYRQLQITEGDGSTDVPVPVECERRNVAENDDAK